MADKGSIGMSFGLSRDDADAPVAAPAAFRIVALAGLGGARPGTLLSIDKNSVVDAFETLDVSLFLSVPDLLSGRTEDLTIRAPIRALADFRADRIARHEPTLAAAVALRDALAEVQAGRRTLDAIRPVLDATRALPMLRPALALCEAQPAPAPAARPAPPPAEEPADDGLDALLSMVDVPSAPSVQAQAQRALNSLVGDVIGAPKAAGRTDVKAALAAVDEALAPQLAKITADPAVAAAETAWRALRLLVERCDFRAGVRLDVIDAAKDEAAEALRTLVVEPELAGTAEVPPALVILDYAFDATTADLDRLEALADLAESVQAPVIVAVGPGFLGLDSMAEVARLDNPPGRLEGNDRWNALRDKDLSRWLAAVANRFLLPSRSKDALPARYANAPWIVAAQAAASVARVGWPTELTGTANAFGDLPVAAVKVGSGTVESGLEAPVPTAAAHGLADAGLMVLAGGPNDDRAILVTTPSVHRPGRIPGEDDPAAARLLSSLSYQLMAAHVARGLNAAMPDVMAEASDEGRKAKLERALVSLAAETGPGAAARVSVAPDERDPRRSAVHIELRAGRAVLGGASVHLDFAV